MINLPKRKSTFNFFESFSDLVFCTLVLFLVLVLFLAMNVNQKAEAIEIEGETQRQEIAAEITQLEADRELARQALEDAQAQNTIAQLRRETLDDQLAQAEAQRQAYDRQRQRYEQALGTHRFTDPAAQPRMVVAYDWQPRRIRVHPVPAWLIAQMNTDPAGMNDAQRAEYLTALRGRFVEIANQVEPLSPRQYRALMRAMSIGIQPMTDRQRKSPADLGIDFAFTSDAVATTTVARVVPGGNAQHAGVRVGDELVALGEQIITPESLAALLMQYAPGDAVRLLLTRAGQSLAVDMVFRQEQLVRVGEAFRTDLSLIISGARDVQYRYLWEPGLADALRGRLQRGEAADAVWQQYNQTQGKRAAAGRPVLPFDIGRRGEQIMIGGEVFSADQFRRILESLAGGSVVIEYQADSGPGELPQWVHDRCMIPTGYVTQAPLLDLLDDELEREGE